MKQLVVARHGMYNSRHQLSDEGRVQIDQLAYSLHHTLARYPLEQIALLSSTADRAKDSADRLASFFGLTVEYHEVLWSEGGHREDLPAAFDLVSRYAEKAGLVVMVTHLEYGEKFPEYYAKQALGQSWRTPGLSYGQGILIDCTVPDWKRLP
jgi:phosphohistidine phosphatase SixA